MPIDHKIRETRDPNYLIPELKKRWLLSEAEYNATYPDEPEVFLTQTYRSKEYQDYLYEQGRTRPGLIVTGVRGGHSYHNAFPALAFDIAFKIPRSKGGPWSRADLFRKFADIAKKYDLDWGGDWENFVDMPHFQVPRIKLKDAVSGVAIPWKELPYQGPTITGDVNFSRIFYVGREEIKELELEKITLVGDKLYIKPK